MWSIATDRVAWSVGLSVSVVRLMSNLFAAKRSEFFWFHGSLNSLSSFEFSYYSSVLATRRDTDYKLYAINNKYLAHL